MARGKNTLCTAVNLDNGRVTELRSWEGVADRLDLLREAYVRGPAQQVFGASGHAFIRAPALSEGDVEEVEGQLGVRLPEDYRAFLIEVASGGAGPGYGVFVLRRDSSGSWGWEGDGAELTERNSLNAAFAPSDVTVELAQLDAEAPSIDDAEAYEAWMDQRDDLLWNSTRTHGAVCLSHEGCAYRDWLVVSGPSRGQMWDDERAGDVDLAPSTTSSGVRSFASWFGSWLSDAERKATGA